MILHNILTKILWKIFDVRYCLKKWWWKVLKWWFDGKWMKWWKYNNDDIPETLWDAYWKNVNEKFDMKIFDEKWNRWWFMMMNLVSPESLFLHFFGGGGVAQEQVQVQDLWFAVCCCVPAVLVGVGFLLLQRSGGDMHTCMLVLAGWVQEQVQVKASGGRRERFHSYGKMLYMHTQGLRWR